MQPKVIVAFVAGALLVGATTLILSNNKPGETDLAVGKNPAGSSSQTVAQKPAPKPASSRTVTVPAGSVIRASLQSSLASHESQAGDDFSMTVTEPVYVNGYMAIPRGATVRGEVVSTKQSGKISGRGEITLAFRTVTDINGKSHNLDAENFYAQAEGVSDRDAAMIAGGTAAGAIIGGIAGGKKGALIGGLIGGGAGTGTVLATKGPEVKLGSGAVFAIQLDSGLEMPAGSRTVS